MKAGYLVGQWIQNKLNSMGYSGVIATLARSIGARAARAIVQKVVTVGATAAAGYVALFVGGGGSIAGPVGAIIGWASGWL